MDKQELTQLLQQVADGDVTPDDAALRLKMQPFQEIGAYAKVDFHRGIRQGVPEVIFGEGKAKEHILGIAREMLRSGQRTILITRLSAEADSGPRSFSKRSTRRRRPATGQASGASQHRCRTWRAIFAPHLSRVASRTDERLEPHHRRRPSLGSGHIGEQASERC